MGRFRELDGLRGIAAIAVVVYHFLDGRVAGYPNDPKSLFEIPWGAYGVQLFFLISGFVILMSARASNRPSDFAISRATRLYPAYWVSLAVAVLVAWWASVPSIPLSPTVILANLTMVQRWFLVPNVLDVYWTLAVEMQFYVLLLLLIWLTRSRLTDRVMVTVAGTWLVLSLAVAVWAFPSSHGIDPQSVATPVKLILNLTLAAYGPLFCTGMLAFISRGENRLHWMTIPSAGTAVLTTGLLQTWDAAAWVGGICLGFIIVSMRKRTRILTIAPLQWLGKISYSLYLMHTAVGYALIHALWPAIGRPGAVLFAVVVAVLASWAVYEVAERRVSRWARDALTRLRDRRTTSPTAEPAS